MTAAIPLAAEDRAILALECQTVVGHTCKVVRLAGPLDIERLRARVTSRIELAPVLTRRLGGGDAEPVWVADEDFDVTRHVVAADVAGPIEGEGLRALVAELFEQHLERERPLWRMDVVPLSDGGTVLVWRIHHALADGTTCVRYCRTLLWDADEQPPRTAAQTSAAHTAHAEDDARRRAHLAGFLRRECARSRVRSPFDGRIGARREVGLAVVSLRDLHDAARAIDGATVNDAVLSIVAGALWRWLESHHGHPGAIRVRVPVSLHHEGDTLANRDSFFSLDVPLGELDPVARLREIHRRTTVRKRSQDAEEREQLLEELGHVSPSLQRMVTRLESSPRSFALSVSNVPGPPRPVRVLEASVQRLHSIAEIGERHALRVSAVSLAGLLCIGFVSDPQLVERVDVMATGVEDEAQELLRAAAQG